MDKKLNPKKFIYDNGLKTKKDQSNQVYLSYSNDQLNSDEMNLKYDYPLIYQNKHGINKNKIFTTEIDKDPKKDSFDSEMNDMFLKEVYTSIMTDNNNNKIQKIKNIKSCSCKKKLSELCKFNIMTEVEKICNHLYNSIEKKDEKNEEYIKLLKKNYLYDQTLVNPYLDKERILFKKFKYKNLIQRNNNKFKKYKNLKDNKTDIINKYNNDNFRELNKDELEQLTRFKFENYGIKSPTIKHPQLYKLKFDNKNLILPPIKSSNNRPVELSDFIPEIKIVDKDEKRKEYMDYKDLVSQRSRHFHI